MIKGKYKGDTLAIDERGDLLTVTLKRGPVAICSDVSPTTTLFELEGLLDDYRRALDVREDKGEL